MLNTMQSTPGPLPTTNSCQSRGVPCASSNLSYHYSSAHNSTIQEGSELRVTAVLEPPERGATAIFLWNLLATFFQEQGH
jgi:hypothetical protein